MASSATWWVIDANLALRAVMPGPERAEAAALLERAGTILVPTLWVYEVTSVLRKMVRGHPSWRPAAEDALGAILALPDQIVPPDESLARAALDWADRLGHANAYDAFYLALAAREGALLWTYDKRLYRRVRQVGADFVRLPGGEHEA